MESIPNYNHIGVYRKEVILLDSFFSLSDHLGSI